MKKKKKKKVSCSKKFYFPWKTYVKGHTTREKNTEIINYKYKYKYYERLAK